jgi:hypothetical protein
MKLTQWGGTTPTVKAKYKEHMTMDSRTDNHEEMLNTLKQGNAQDIATMFSTYKDTMGPYFNAEVHLASLFERYPQMLASLSKRLATAPTWAEFDTIFEAIVKAAPEIKTLKSHGLFQYRKLNNELEVVDTMPHLSGVPEFQIPFQSTTATLASGLMCACELFGTDPNRTRTMIVKLKNNRFTLSGMESQLSGSHTGKAIASMISAEKSGAGKAA